MIAYVLFGAGALFLYFACKVSSKKVGAMPKEEPDRFGLDLNDAFIRHGLDTNATIAKRFA